MTTPTMPTSTTMTWHKKLFAIIILLLLIPIYTTAKVYLVSVGIADYPDGITDLKAPIKDAQTITWVYSKNSQIKYRQILNSRATNERIIATMNKLFSKAKQNDYVIFYFSGHGYEGGFKTYDGYLDYKEIRNAMAKSKCKNKIIFADACFSGKIRTKKPIKQNEISATQKANVMLFLSSRDNEISLESAALKNGFFTTYLQKGLRGEADVNHDRTITAKELFNYVYNNVVNISNGKQHPVMWGNFSHEMPIIIWK